MRIIAVLAVAALLAGCSTTTPAEKLALNQSTCASYGFKANTDAYSTCMMQMDLDQQQQDRDQRRRIGAALAGMGAAMATPTRSAVTCNTFGNARRSSFGTYGNSTTTCY